MYLSISCLIFLIQNSSTISGALLFIRLSMYNHLSRNLSKPSMSTLRDRAIQSINVAFMRIYMLGFDRLRNMCHCMAALA